MRSLFQTFIVIATICLFTSCKKTNETETEPETPFSGCHVVKIENSGTAPFFITYTPGGKLNTITHGTVVSTFTYTNNGFVRSFTDENDLIAKDFYVFDTEGKLVSLRYEYYGQYGTELHVQNNEYEYFNKQPFRNNVSTNSGFPDYRDMYTWTNGDLTKIETSSANGTFTMTYDTDKAYREGDYGFVNFITGGTFSFKNEHLITSITKGTSKQLFSYIYDADGKIISLYVGTNANSSYMNYNLTYECL